jgi:hypothetical protein
MMPRNLAGKVPRSPVTYLALVAGERTVRSMPAAGVRTRARNPTTPELPQP